MKIMFFEKFDKLQSDKLQKKIIFYQLKREVHNFVQSFPMQLLFVARFY